MGTKSIKSFLNQRCRFRLRSGKEVFGVIWKLDDHEGEYVFSSISDHEVYLKTRDPNRIKNTLSVDINEIIHAEKLAN